MTVAELMVLLAACPPDAVVLTDGCDCVGLADGITGPHSYDVFIRDDGTSGDFIPVTAVTIDRNDSDEFARTVVTAKRLTS